MRTRKWLLTAAIGLASIIGLQLVGVPSASAHDTSASIWLCGASHTARCGYGGVTNNHQRVYSCDTNADNYGFRNQYILQNGASGYVDDANGSASGCSAIWPGSSSNPVVWFRVIWKVASPSGWVYTSWFPA